MRAKCKPKEIFKSKDYFLPINHVKSNEKYIKLNSNNYKVLLHLCSSSTKPNRKHLFHQRLVWLPWSVDQLYQHHWRSCYFYFSWLHFALCHLKNYLVLGNQHVQRTNFNSYKEVYTTNIKCPSHPILQPLNSPPKLHPLHQLLVFSSKNVSCLQ